MKKRLFLSIILILIFGFVINVNALTNRNYVTTLEYNVNDVIDNNHIEGIEMLNVGNGYQLNFYQLAYHDDISDPHSGQILVNSKLTYSSSLNMTFNGNGIATIDSNGVIFATGEGNVSITMGDITKTFQFNCVGVSADTYRLDFKSNGGNDIDSISKVVAHLPLLEFENTVLPTPTKEGYKFEGWYADEALTIKIDNLTEDFEKLIFEEEVKYTCPTGLHIAKVYAKWSKIADTETPKQDEDKVENIPDTGITKSNILIIVGLLSVTIGISIVYYVRNVNSGY